eukprot:gb/GECG01012397.1/.p1 GENE.gb/GECG01012397.1/~~gb/GECG01012397.1/.p1  ORF type:complete len:582 (+),score=58.88 gb/GECG01012397.1/:1-1746(+)
MNGKLPQGYGPKGPQSLNDPQPVNELTYPPQDLDDDSRKALLGKQMTSKKKECLYTLSFILLFCGLGMILASVFVPPYIHKQIKEGVRKAVVLDGPNSEGYSSWASSEDKDSPVISYYVYLFNVTNPEEVTHNASKPILEEVGPIKLRYRYRKYNVKFMNDNEIARFMLWEFYTIDDDEPTRDLLLQNVTTVNVPFLVTQGFAHDILEYLACRVQPGFKEALKEAQSKLLESRTIHELLFGFQNPLIGNFSGLLGNESQNANKNKEEYIEIDTGKANVDNAHQYRIWNNYPSIKCLPGRLTPLGGISGTTPVSAWDNSLPSTGWKVMGTSGTQFKPGFTKDDSPTVFEDTMYRHFTLKYGNVDPEIKGITTYRFRLPQSAVLNASANPDNSVYFADGPSGLLNVSRCEHNMPLFFSQPYFYQGDPGLRTNVSLDASPPNMKEKYDTYLDIEPHSGTPFRVSERLQLNAKISHGLCYDCGSGKTYTCFPNTLNGTYLPLMWLWKHGEIPDHLANKFKDGVYRNQKIATGVLYGGYSAGGLLCVIAFLVIWCVSRHRTISPSSTSKKWEESLYNDGALCQSLL